MGRPYDRAKDVAAGKPWSGLTYQLIGLAMEVHNELGPGHREAAYHNALHLKLMQAQAEFETEPYVAVTLADGSEVRGNAPDFLVGRTVIVELKAHFFTMSKDEEAQVIGYFAGFPEAPVALYFNFGRTRLETHRLLPPLTVQAYRRESWGRR